jgi:hypothetical protein
MSALLGISLNYIYSFAGFKWVDSLSQKILFLLMSPAMTVIAWTISGNLGLSLGMIGALSIVRFRTPIKSPLELVVYFVLIVIGISITVSPIYSLMIYLLAVISPFIFLILHKIPKDNLYFADKELNNAQIANFRIEANSEDLVNFFNKNNIVPIHFNEDKNSKEVQISLKVNNLNEFSDIKKKITKIGSVISSDYIS